MTEKKRVCCTNAMGLNSTTASIAGWKQLILKEEQAREEWRDRYAADLNRVEDSLIEKVKNRASDLLPRDDEEDTLLREGISKEGKGRQAFLKERAVKGPQQKFRRPLTESQRIGWTCTQLPPPSEHAQHFGRKPVIESNFYRKTGVFTSGLHMVN
eukprot:TRINITY_DN3599_c0_g1_i1.p1 TRINITY_DN3599_c0_g1~~TRINITY_DN3599_c0_g1_i1.p1  ORF type:complete len:156 (+),score=23.38 TRINITY_DN3599_c0_g1_i1:41-508(+)